MAWGELQSAHAEEPSGFCGLEEAEFAQRRWSMEHMEHGASSMEHRVYTVQQCRARNRPAVEPIARCPLPISTRLAATRDVAGPGRQ